MSASESRDDSFETESNSPFYFNTSHWRAVDGMLEGVRERAGLMVLTGPTGSGKTMIMRAISEGLEENTPGLFLQYASLNFREFVNFLHSSLRVEDEVMDSPNKAVALREYLYVQAKRGETGVVFIDEAHNLEPDVLKMLPKLARFDTLEDGRIVGLQFVLIGSEDLREIISDTEFDEVRAKITVDHTLRFFSRAELKQFLKKRLAPIARMTDEPITEDGIEEMGRFTGGSPRLIGMICSHTMLFAAENPGKSIDATMVQEAAEALMLSPVDNPFADEENDLRAAAGPFSEADLSGETQKAAATPVLPQFSSTETVYSTDAPDAAITLDPSAQVDELNAGTTPDIVGEDVTPRGDESLYAADHVAVAKTQPAAKDEEDAADDDDDLAEFDHAAFDRALEDDEDDDGDFDDGLDDDEFSDLDEGDETLGAVGKPKVKKGGTSFLTRLGLKKKAGTESSKVMGASRKKDKPVDPAPVAKATRGPKAIVAGEREKKLKMAGIAAAVIAVAGIGYAAKDPVISAVQGMMSKSPQTAQATRPASDAAGDSRTTALSPDQARKPVTMTVENTRSPSTGGWGARVVIANEGDGPAPATDPVRTASTDRAIPAPAANMAKGALDLVDKALGMGERNASNEKVGGVLAAASNQVAGLRDRLAGNGLSPQEAAAKADTLVAQGDAYLADRRYIAPSDGNAYDAYREALALQPTNEKAKAGITTLREHFAKKAEGARNARQWESANGYFETAIAISNLRPVN